MMLLLYLPVLFFSVILHEYMHGYVAYRRGDDTAYLMGRLTFNPLPHIDPIGTIIVPALCFMSGLPIFGWAKPVPVNFTRLYSPQRDMAWVAAAGPLSNVFLIIFAALALKLLIGLGIHSGISIALFMVVIQVNLILAIFNMLPIPPLDGSKVFAALLPRDLAHRYMMLERYSMIIIIVLILSRALNYILIPAFYFSLSLIFRFIGVANGQF